jgi:quercetin dioxygenase-like cupin family protein
MIALRSKRCGSANMIARRSKRRGSACVPDIVNVRAPVWLLRLSVLTICVTTTIPFLSMFSDFSASYYEYQRLSVDVVPVPAGDDSSSSSRGRSWVNWTDYSLLPLDVDAKEAVIAAHAASQRFAGGERAQYEGPPSLQQCHAFLPECAALAQVFAPIARQYLGPNAALSSVNAIERRGPSWHHAHSDFGTMRCVDSLVLWIGLSGVSRNSTVKGLSHTESYAPADELMNERGCCATECHDYSLKVRGECSDDAFFAHVQRGDKRVRVIDGPVDPFVGFLIPGRMYHAGFNQLEATLRSAIIIQFSKLDNNCIVREQKSYERRLLSRMVPVLRPIPGAIVPPGLLPNLVWPSKPPQFRFNSIFDPPKHPTSTESNHTRASKISFFENDAPERPNEATYTSCYAAPRVDAIATPSLSFVRFQCGRGPTLQQLKDTTITELNSWIHSFHHHDVQELFFVSKGALFVEIYARGKHQPPLRMDLRQGDLLFIPSGVPHTLVSSAPDTSFLDLQFLGRFDTPYGDKPKDKLSGFEADLFQASLMRLGYADSSFNRLDPQAHGQPCRKRRNGRWELFEAPVSATLSVHSFLECGLQHVPLHSNKHDLWVVVVRGDLSIHNGAGVARIVSQGDFIFVPGSTTNEMRSVSSAGTGVDVLVVELSAMDISEEEFRHFEAAQLASATSTKVLHVCYSNVCTLYPGTAFSGGLRFPNSGVYFESGEVVVRRGDGSVSWRVNVSGAEKMLLQGDGNWLALSPTGKVIWAAGVSLLEDNRKPFRLSIVADGQLSILDADGVAVWNTNSGEFSIP